MNLIYRINPLLTKLQPEINTDFLCLLLKQIGGKLVLLLKQLQTTYGSKFAKIKIGCSQP